MCFWLAPDQAWQWEVRNDKDDTGPDSGGFRSMLGSGLDKHGDSVEMA